MVVIWCKKESGKNVGENMVNEWMNTRQRQEKHTIN